MYSRVTVTSSATFIIKDLLQIYARPVNSRNLEKLTFTHKNVFPKANGPNPIKLNWGDKNGSITSD